jgi:hypothetical protein
MVDLADTDLDNATDADVGNATTNITNETLWMIRDAGEGRVFIISYRQAALIDNRGLLGFGSTTRIIKPIPASGSESTVKADSNQTTDEEKESLGDGQETRGEEDDLSSAGGEAANQTFPNSGLVYDLVELVNPRSLWMLTDAGHGFIFITSHRSYNLREADRNLELGIDRGSQEKWRIVVPGGGDACSSHAGELTPWAHVTSCPGDDRSISECDAHHLAAGEFYAARIVEECTSGVLNSASAVRVASGRIRPVQASSPLFITALDLDMANSSGWILIGWSPGLPGDCFFKS